MAKMRKTYETNCWSRKEGRGSGECKEHSVAILHKIIWKPLWATFEKET
jgi:hypothetical protein